MSNRYLGITALSGLLVLAAIAGGRADDATLLPNAIQYFMDANGKPLANGKVYMYTPNSTTPKTTWTTAGKGTAQPQPFIPLGISGKPASPIYGEGSYRQLVKDSVGNTIWDYNTASTGGGSTPSGTTVGDGIAVGTIMPFDGMVAPANYMFAYGQTISRTTYSALLASITLTDSIVCTAGTSVISNFSTTKQLAITMPIESSCLPPGTTITSVPTDTTVGVSNNATVSGVFTIQVFPSGRGDGSTTFNLPDLRGKTLAGRDNMGGTPAGRLTATYFSGSSGTGIAQSGGNQSSTILTGNLPPYTPGGTIVNGAITSIFTGTAGQAALTSTGGAQAFASGSFASQQVTGTVASTQAGSSFIGTAAGGTSTPYSIVQPTMITNWIIKVFPDSLSSDATWQVPLNAVPVGRGVGTGFDSVAVNASTTPKFLQQSGDGVTATAPLWGTVQQFVTTSTISGLRGLAAGVSNTVYVQGYHAAGDGAEGTVYWDPASVLADNACTVIQPNSLPATGRWIRQVGGTEYNVRWCGATGDGATDDYAAINTTVGLAIASKGTVYFPSTPFRYLMNSAIVIPDGTHGLTLRGDARAATVASNQGAEIATTASSVFNMTGVALGGTGSISNIDINNLTLIATGASGRALKIWNVDDIRLNNVLVDATQGNAVDMAGTAHFSFNLVSMFAAGGCPFFVSQAAVGAQNIGPGFIDNSLVSITNDSFSAICLVNEPLGVEFRNLDITWVNSTAVAAVDLNGPTPSAFSGVGALKFNISHAESTYNTTNTGKTFRVGNTNAFGTLQIEGGNYWVHGNGTNYQQDWLQVVNAQNVMVDGTVVSKLASTNGASRAMIRLESTFTGALAVRNPIATISGTTYSDQRSVSVPCSGTGSCWTDGLILDALTLGTPLAATSGGTGFASYAVGDVLAASSTTALSKISDVAVNNVFQSGGIGALPLYGKVANAALTNSATTVNGQTCTLGSTCTVTAAATAVTVGTTTISGGTSHGVLTNNAGVLGNTALGTSGQLFLGVTGAEPNWGTMSGGASITNSGVVTVLTNANLTGDVTSIGNATTLAAGNAGNLNSGTLLAARMPAHTGDVTSSAGSVALTLAAGSASVLNSGTLLAARMPALTGDITTSAGAVATTLATVNSNVGTFGSATQAAQVTVNAKGLTTAAANVTITPAVGSITGLGTGVATALGVNVGSAGAFVTFNGAGGTPSAITLTNASGTAASLTAGNVTTNANLTGAVTSVGNATSLGSFSSANLSGALTDETGSGVAVFGTSPVLSTVDARGTWTTGTSWTLPAHTVSPAANTAAITASGYSITGAGTTPLFDLSGTWNTSGAPTAIKLNVTNTAANSASLLMDLQTGGTSEFAVRKDGFTTTATIGADTYATRAGSTIFSIATLAGQATSLSFVGAIGLNSASGVISSQSSNNIMLSDSGATTFGRLQFGGTTTSFPAIKRSSATLAFRLADDSADTSFTASTGTLSAVASDAATTDNTLCISGAGVILKGSGTLGICLGTSSARYKRDIVSMGAGLAELVRLSPKNFFYRKGFGDDGARLQYGFIAEEVVKVLPGVTAPDKEGKPNSVDMVAMIPVLVNAIKQLKSDNDNLRMDVLALQAKAAGGKK